MDIYSLWYIYNMYYYLFTGTEMMRPTWEEYFFELARVTATRATCRRKSVGCVLVRDNRVVAQGYNGSPPGEPHCLDVGCWLEDGHCVATVHAEVNAVCQAAKNGTPIDGTTAYVTVRPCWPCHLVLKSAGVTTIQYLEEYGAPYPSRSL